MTYSANSTKTNFIDDIGDLINGGVGSAYNT